MVLDFLHVPLLKMLLQCCNRLSFMAMQIKLVVVVVIVVVVVVTELQLECLSKTANITK